MPIAYWCVLIAALLPLGFVAYAKSDAFDDHMPRDAAAQLTGARRRAYAAHQNGYENFPFFAAAVIISVTMGAPIATVNLLAMLYIVARIAHGVCYIAGLKPLRTAMFGFGLLLNIAIFVLPAFK